MQKRIVRYLFFSKIKLTLLLKDQRIRPFAEIWVLEAVLQAQIVFFFWNIVVGKLHLNIIVVELVKLQQSSPILVKIAT